MFPHGSVSIRIEAPDVHERAAAEAALSGPDGIESDIRELLAEARCPIPSTFHVQVTVLESDNNDLDIAFGAIEAAPKPTPAIAAARPNAHLRVIQGKAEPCEVEIKSDRVNLGRLKEVSGEKDGLRRRNDIAFAETETSVSRERSVTTKRPAGSICRTEQASAARQCFETVVD